MTDQATCQTLCTRTAGSGDVPIFPVTGLCQFQAQGYTISDVVVSGCNIPTVAFEPVAEVPRAALMTVTYEVSFAFTAIHPDGHQEQRTQVCSGSVQFVQPATARNHRLLVPPQCTPSLSCRATGAGFDPSTAVQSFVVVVFGSVDCLGCSQQEVPVEVQLCPSSGSATTSAGKPTAEGKATPSQAWPQA